MLGGHPEQFKLMFERVYLILIKFNSNFFNLISNKVLTELLSANVVCNPLLRIIYIVSLSVNTTATSKIHSNSM